jgi:hypothetical protein
MAPIDSETMASRNRIRSAAASTEIFHGQNWGEWILNTRLILRQADLWDLITGESQRPKEGDKENQEEYEADCLRYEKDSELVATYIRGRLAPGELYRI